MLSIVEFLAKKHLDPNAGKFTKDDFEKLQKSAINFCTVKVDLYKRKLNTDKFSKTSFENIIFMFDYLYDILTNLDESSKKNIQSILWYNVGGKYGGFNVIKKKNESVGHFYCGGISEDEWLFSVHDSTYAAIEDKSDLDHEDIIYKLNKLLK